MNNPPISLDIYYKLKYCYCDLQYDARREITLSAAGGRQSARAGAGHDATGSRPRHQQGAEAEDQPILPVTDRKRIPAAPDQQDQVAAGEVLQSSSRIPGGRSPGIPHRAAL